MVRLLYKPRFKKGFFKNQKFLQVSKGPKFSKKLKWRFFSQPEEFSQKFSRNDLFLQPNNIFEQQKRHATGTFTNKKFLSFFCSIKKRALTNFINKCKRNSYRVTYCESLIFFMEFRLDFMLFRSNLVKSLFQARFLIFKGFVLVNSKKIYSSSFVLKEGDLVNLNLNPFHTHPFFNNEIFTFSTHFVEVCFTTFSFLLLRKQKSGNFYINGLYPFYFNLEELMNFNTSN